MFLFEEEAEIGQDREDLIQLLTMRFGSISPELLEAIYQLDDFETIERLILVAANTHKLETFVEELEQGEGSFKIVGERFNPIENLKHKGDIHGQ